MLREIINFTKDLSKENIMRGLDLPPGLYLELGIKDDKLQIKKKDVIKHVSDKTDFLSQCQEKLSYTICVSPRKKLDSPYKLNTSSSPFCIAFTKDIFQNKLMKIEIKDYFKKLSNNAIQFCITDEQKKMANKFLNNIDDEILNQIMSLDEYREINKNSSIYIFFNDPNLPDYEQVHSNYLSQKVFNKEIYNKELDGKIYGVSDYLSTFTNKKLFLKHQTAAFDINSRLSGEDALYLYKFSQMQLRKTLPNPLPIFIDKKELNDDVVSIFNRDDKKKISYSDVIKEIYNREIDLGNYYLLNYYGIKINDFDFVSSFSFKLEPTLYIKDLFGIKNGSLITINDIFSFEKIVVQRIFDNQLVLKTKDDRWRLRYFDDIEYKPQYIRPTMFQLVLKYRKAFYDYIYKSKREALNSQIFNDIMETGILDDLKQDKYENNKHSKGYQIKEKLNIWFSFYEYFDQQKNGEETMANKIKNLQTRMQEIANQENQHVEIDEEFAYAAGQIIYYLLNCSEASNKTHALLEPFLQKSDLTQFKMAISRIFNQYKHAISFYKGRFEKLMAEVLSFEIERNIKELSPMILAGYFAKNVIYMKNE